MQLKQMDSVMADMLVVVAASTKYGSLKSVKTLQPQPSQTMTSTHTRSGLNFIVVDPMAVSETI